PQPPAPALPAPRPAPAPVAARPALPVSPKPALARKPVPARRKFRISDIWKRYLPPVRLVWLFLGILVAVGGGFVSGARAYPLIAIPVVGAIVDLAFQKVRFPRLRFPDAALATSLFLSLIIWPADVSLSLISIAVVAVGLRHFVRAGGHPWFNPAAAGLVLATAIFALPTSWHVGLSNAEIGLVALLGVILMIRAPHAWRIPVFYFASNLIVVLALTFALGAGARWPMAIEYEVLSGASVFFGFFMVTEPRTAPSARWAMALFGIVVGVTSAAFPVLFTEVPVLGALGVIAPFLALMAGNAMTLILPAARGSQRSVPAPSAAPG
ncbi:MAG TPA: RnfABCDGE type electron transport complex subunit D, partial [Thermoplasmata archaeon]|nr:RnfABCDGE type electron transport complex subunit D [Thermoplasmata archaeon]